jgi:hypothetical protein
MDSAGPSEAMHTVVLAETPEAHCPYQSIGPGMHSERATTCSRMEALGSRAITRVREMFQCSKGNLARQHGASSSWRATSLPQAIVVVVERGSSTYNKPHYVHRLHHHIPSPPLPSSHIKGQSDAKGQEKDGSQRSPPSTGKPVLRTSPSRRRRAYRTQFRPAPQVPFARLTPPPSRRRRHPSPTHPRTDRR